MKEKAIVSTATLVASLLAYWYAKQASRDSVPYVMFGGFVGAIVGEVIAEKIKQGENDEQNP